jgi:CBS domain-containing protein
VFRYTAGKMDWLASGWPIEGKEAGTLRAGDVARRDVPTCRLDERVDSVRDRLRAARGEQAVVVNDAGVILGVVSEDVLTGYGEATVEDIMEPGPRTVRPHLKLHEAEETMTGAERDRLLVTTSAGELIGVLRREDVDELAI